MTTLIGDAFAQLHARGQARARRQGRQLGAGPRRRRSRRARPVPRGPADAPRRPRRRRRPPGRCRQPRRRARPGARRAVHQPRSVRSIPPSCAAPRRSSSSHAPTTTSAALCSPTRSTASGIGSRTRSRSSSSSPAPTARRPGYTFSDLTQRSCLRLCSRLSLTRPVTDDQLLAVAADLEPSPVFSESSRDRCARSPARAAPVSASPATCYQWLVVWRRVHDGAARPRPATRRTP